MSKNKALQLAFNFAVHGQDEPAALFTASRPMRLHRLCNNVLRKARYVRRFFPELGTRTIRIGLTHAASGMAVPGGSEVWFNPNRLSYHTIAHEFMHLLQGKLGIPTGERSCDLFSLARHWTLNDAPPYYIRIPSGMVDRWGHIQPAGARLMYAVARQSVELRAAGTRNYIAYFERSLADAKPQWNSSEGIGLFELKLLT
jgi:hypothetical protein